MSVKHPRRAIYVLANDAVYEWLVALLGSIRTHLPGASVRLVPFDERTELTARLQGEFGFEMFEHESFAWLVDIGKRLEIGRTPLGPNWFKRLAVFFGLDESFLYLDARALLLSDISAGFEAMESGTVDFVHFGGDPNQSFETGPIRRELSSHGRCFGFNSGCWISRRNLFSREDMERAAAFCSEKRDQLNPRNTDQFFLNILCAQSFARVVNLADLDGKFVRDPWAFVHTKVFRKHGEVRVWSHGGMSHARTLPLVHWAGTKLSPAMPLRRLWTDYRYDGRPPLSVRLEPLTSLPARAVDAARRSLLIRRIVSPKNAGL